MDHLVVPLDLVAATCVHSIDIYERRIIVKEIARLTDLIPLVVERKILVEGSPAVE